MSLVSETIRTKGKYVLCERLWYSINLVMITVVLMNACMQGSTHSHVLLGARSYHVITIVHSPRLLCCLQPHSFQPRSSSRHSRMSL